MMPTYSYRARPVGGGDIQTGEIELPTTDAVLGWLHRRRLVAVSVRQKRSPLSLTIGSGVRTREVVIFTRQFATMIHAGLPLIQSLDILAQQTENAVLKRSIQDVRWQVESGNALADALGKHPKVFGDLFVNMVAAGEAGGILDTILLRLAAFLEKSDALLRKIKGAMVYPGVILAVAVLSVATLLVFVIPTFQDMFASVGVPLPLATRAVIGASQVLGSYWWVLCLAVVAVGLLIRSAHATRGGRLALDRLMLTLPVLGDIQRKAAVARFTRTLGTLVSSGVSILDGLEITAKTAGNRVIHDAIMGARAAIAGGATIAGPLGASGVFPSMVVQMIHVGEQTGGLDEMLTKIADFYDDEVDVAVSALLSAMEPLMIVVLGTLVGGMILAMYLPIFDMISALG